MSEFFMHGAGLSPAESHQILIEWNKTARSYPGEYCLHQLIEEQVERTPDSHAVTSGIKQLTYRELNSQANQLAHYLRTLGVGPETLVGIATERSVETIVALLAVLKAGGAYVPLDPHYPPERLRFMLDDSQAVVLLTKQSLLDHFPTAGKSVICLDTDWPAIAALPKTNLAPLATSENLAYVIYTSGSTGTPKGVLVPHRQLAHTTSAQFAYDAPSAFLLVLSFSFDASGFVIYWTLCRGGQLVIPTDEQVQDPRLLRRLIEEKQVSHLDCAPSLYRLILEANTGSLESMRYSFVGGEACPPQLVAQHYRLLPHARLINNYGPTETTILSIRLECRKESSVASSVPIGRPIPNVRIYLLDEHLNPVPIGAAGELYIAGEGITRGYLNRPDLTAERFVPNPFALKPGERLYRTGDLAQYLSEGNIDFIGRVDYQVKLRGYRIELGEIEATLQHRPEVTEAVVEAREDMAGEKRLVAYIVARGDSTPTRATLVSFLEEKLPAYMVPRLFVFLDELPRNVSGKVERKALPAPEIQRTEAERDFIAPQTPTEEAIAQAFAMLLGVERVSMNDNIFDLGGNSLLIAQVVLYLSNVQGIDLPAVQLFKNPTAAGVAQAIEAYQSEGRNSLMERDVACIKAEAVLDPTITPEGLPMANFLDPSHILLTGATGYLGAFLLESLLKETRAEVFCLVRASNDETGLERLKKALQFYRIWDDAFLPRIHTVTGDLEKPLLGLSASQFSELAGTIDVIYHTGALVNFLYPYAALRAANVQGTQEILRLACQVKVKAVHYVSTLDVFIANHATRPFLELDQPGLAADVRDGYSQSKWVAEEVVSIARSRGLPVSVYRLGLIMSHTRTGATQPGNYLLLEVKGFLQLGMALGQDLLINVIPVDYAARAILHLSRQQVSFGKYFHLWNLCPVTVNQVYDWLHSFGYKLDVVALDALLPKLMNIDPSNPLFPLIPTFAQINEPDEFDPSIQQGFDPRIECFNSLEGLVGSSIESPPPMTEELAHLCFAYLVDVGFLEPPEAQVVAHAAAGVS